MTWIADAGLWTAIVLTGIAAGMLAPWWRRDGRPAFVESVLLAAAAASVAALCARAGQLISGSLSNPWLASFVPIEVGPLSRLAVLWATLPGGALTASTILLVWLAVSPRARSSAAGNRRAMIITVMALALSGVSAWFAPAPGLAGTIPPFAQHLSATIAPLLALVAVIVTTWACVHAFTQREPASREFQLAWLLSTAAIGLEQVARSALGIGPRDAIMLGSASSGLVLWLMTSALLHDGVRRRLLRVAGTVSHSRSGALVAHTGAVCVAVSFALHAFAARSNVTLPPGQPVEVMDAFRKPWVLVNQGVSRFDEEGVDVTSLAVDVRTPGGKSTLLTPEIREYHAPDGQHLGNGIVRRKSTRGPVQAMRILFTEADSLDAGSVRVTFLPAPVLWPVGVLMLLVAAVAGLLRREPSIPHHVDT